MILAIETATPVCSVAFMGEDGSVFEKRESGRGIHSEKLFLFIEMLKKEHDFRIGDLKEILLSSGPGSYTGLRIGAAAVKGLLFRRKTPLFLLGSLEAMAAGAFHAHPEAKRVHALIDARRQHLYHQEFLLKKGELSGSHPATTAVKVVDKSIRPGDIVVGTGLKRLEIHKKWGGTGTESDPAGSVSGKFGPTGAGSGKTGAEEVAAATLLDESVISAVNLIIARNNPLFNNRFVTAQPEHFEPEYLSVG